MICFEQTTCRLHQHESTEIQEKNVAQRLCCSSVQTELIGYRLLIIAAVKGKHSFLSLPGTHTTPLSKYEMVVE